MNKKLKIGLGIFLGIAITLISYIGLGLYYLTIEDFHGGYEEVYHASKDGDLVVLINNKGEYIRFGTIKRKDWKAYISPSGYMEKQNIYEWDSLPEQERFIEIYRAGIFSAIPPTPKDLMEMKQLILDKKVSCKRRLKYDW